MAYEIIAKILMGFCIILMAIPPLAVIGFVTYVLITVFKGD